MVLYSCGEARATAPVSAALLDVNVLIARLDPRHGHHEWAHTGRSLPRHRFWAIFRCRLTRLSLLTPGVLASDRRLDASQFTDADLLARAVVQGFGIGVTGVA